MCKKDRHHDFDETEMMNLLNQERMNERKRKQEFSTPEMQLPGEKRSREDKGMEMEREL